MKLKLISGLATIICSIGTASSVQAGPPFTINVNPTSALEGFGIELCNRQIPIIEIIVDYNRSATAWFLTDPFSGEVPNTPFCHGMIRQRFSGSRGLSSFDSTHDFSFEIAFPEGAAHKSREIRYHQVDQSYFMDRGDLFEIEIDMSCKKRVDTPQHDFYGELEFFCDASGKLPGDSDNENPFSDHDNGTNNNGAIGFGGNGSGDFEDGEYIGNNDGVVPNDGNGRSLNDRRRRDIKDRRG